MKTQFAIIDNDGACHSLELQGRDAWAHSELIRAEGTGCTPIDNPAPRWAAYVYNLRYKYGLNIQTINEHHEGPFLRTHARYVLRQTVIVVTESNAP